MAKKKKQLPLVTNPPNDQPTQPDNLIDYKQSDQYNELMKQLLITMGETNDRLKNNSDQEEIDKLYEKYLKDAKKIYPKNIDVMTKFNRSMQSNIDKSNNLISRGAYTLMGKLGNTVADKLDDLTDIPVLKQVKGVARFVAEHNRNVADRKAAKDRENYVNSMVNGSVNPSGKPVGDPTNKPKPSINPIKPVTLDESKFTQNPDTTGNKTRPVKEDKQAISRRKLQEKQLKTMNKSLLSVKGDVNSLKKMGEIRALMAIAGLAIFKPMLGILGGIAGGIAGIAKKGLIKAGITKVAEKLTDKKDTKKTTKKTTKSTRNTSKIDSKGNTAKTAAKTTAAKTAAKTVAKTAAKTVAKKQGAKMLISRLALAAGGVLVGTAAAPWIATAAGLYTAYEIADQLGVVDYVGDKISGLMSSDKPYVAQSPRPDNLGTVKPDTPLRAAIPTGANHLDIASNSADRAKVQQSVDVATTAATTGAATTAATIAPIVSSITNNNTSVVTGSNFDFDNSKYQTSYDKGTIVER